VLGIRGADDELTCGTLLFDPQVRDVMDAVLITTAGIAAHGLELRTNDGLVTVESAKWGDFHGCIPADHLDEVGELNDNPPLAITQFDYLQFYREIVAGLIARGL
jgi:triacylglycerol lipase